jgi:hypothetical protein
MKMLLKLEHEMKGMDCAQQLPVRRLSRLSRVCVCVCVCMCVCVRARMLLPGHGCVQSMRKMQDALDPEEALVKAGSAAAAVALHPRLNELRCQLVLQDYAANTAAWTPAGKRSHAACAYPHCARTCTQPLPLCLPLRCRPR